MNKGIRARETRGGMLLREPAENKGFTIEV
jgi:hypothetical protein